MRQGIELIRIKEQQSTFDTVMFHGKIGRLGDSFSALPSQFRSSKALACAFLSPDMEAEAVTLTTHRSLGAEWLSAVSIGSASPAIAKQSKTLPWLTDPRLAAYLVEGISNSSCGYAAHTPITNKSEQRCCAAA